MTTLRAFPAVLLIAFLAVAGCGGSSPTSAAGQSPAASGQGALGGSSSAPASPQVPDASAAAETPAAAASASASPAANPSATPTKPATIVFTDLKLDAQDDPDGQDRVITFASRGAGKITVAVSTKSPMGTPILCLSTATKKIGCKTAGEGKLVATTTKKTESFKVTLRGSGGETPVVDVAVTFPAKAPSVTIANARFDGTDYPETNGINAVLTPRADGDVTLKAEWGGHPFPYEVDLVEQGGSGSTNLANQGPSVGTDVSMPVAGTNPWRLTLQNSGGGFGVTPMTATITWP
jgi:hypothetical protein